MIIIPFPDFFMLFLGNWSVLFKAALAGESRQPHLTLAMGVGGCWHCSGSEGGRGGGLRGSRGSCSAPLSSPVMSLQERTVCRLEPGDETGAWKGLRMGGKAADLGMPAARQFTVCNTCLSAPTVPLCKDPFTIKMTEQFISCARLIDVISLKTLFVFHRCMSSFFPSSRQRTWHFSTLFPW